MSISEQQSLKQQVTLLELVDRVLNKGVVVSGDITLSVADVDLVYVGLRVLLASVSDAATVREMLMRVLPVKAEVRKTREIYRFQGVLVHLDVVAGLGKFLEFEKIIADDSEREEGQTQMEALRRYFQIPEEDLMASSYSDLLESG